MVYRTQAEQTQPL
ncbi:hypothetical protein D030_0252A, partial [Vibrio parahaemolyticus AQ3810]